MENAVVQFPYLPVAAPLVEWYRANARDLPWRHTNDPYRIWVSEIMLQQTRVEAVRPYYVRFLEALPTVEALANAPDDVLFKLWEGLGYYSRARNLRRAAQVVVEEHDGKLPAQVEALRALPGIGPYTAGAVASIAFNIPAAAVDGNVLRVLSRLYASRENIDTPAIKRAAEEAVLRLMQNAQPGEFNQALMELGATVCLPNAAPLCKSCPLLAHCAAYAQNIQLELPVRQKKAPRKEEAHTVFVLRAGENFLVRKRKETGLLAGLWELPNVRGHMQAEEMSAWLAENGLAPVGDIAHYARTHIFTHIEWHLRVYSMQVSGDAPAGYEWAKAADSAHALPTAFRICL